MPKRFMDCNQKILVATERSISFASSTDLSKARRGKPHDRGECLRERMESMVGYCWITYR
jgi:hypothetical protein